MSEEKGHLMRAPKAAANLRATTPRARARTGAVRRLLDTFFDSSAANLVPRCRPKRRKLDPEVPASRGARCATAIRADEFHDSRLGRRSLVLALAGAARASGLPAGRTRAPRFLCSASPGARAYRSRYLHGPQFTVSPALACRGADAWPAERDHPSQWLTAQSGLPRGRPVAATSSAPGA